jgi:hypothetical protein
VTKFESIDSARKETHVNRDGKLRRRHGKIRRHRTIAHIRKHHLAGRHLG